VLPEDIPNQIFDQVIEDKQKFGFDNDVYSKDFFEFNLTIQNSIL
jgi:hypothetical protein